MSNLLFMDESNGNGVYATTATAAILISNTNINNNNNENGNGNTNVNVNINGNSNGNGNENCNDNGNSIENGNILSHSNSFNNNTNNNNNNNNNNNRNNSDSTNINNVMASAPNSAASSAACTCPGAQQLPASLSNEDLSQSLSEYTDADESISAPTEFLAEFLSSVMLKDYKKALKYCKLILQYEPHNSTAKEFYPLILDKLRGATSSDSDENYNKSSSSPELVLEAPSSAGESDEHDALPNDERQRCHHQHMQGHLHADYCGGRGANADPNSNLSSNCNSIEDEDDDDDDDGDDDADADCEGHAILSCGSAAGSLSDSVDVDDEDVAGDDEDGEEAGEDDDDEDDEDEDDDEDDDDDDDDIMSSSGDDLPVDEQQIIVGDILDLDNSGNACGDAALNGSNSSRNSSSGGKISSRSDNTTHSYSSLLLEEEDDIVPVSLQFPRDFHAPDLDVSNGNKIPSTSCSDSESPTEPLTQRLAAILRSKCGVSNTSC